LLFHCAVSHLLRQTTLHNMSAMRVQMREGYDLLHISAVKAEEHTIQPPVFSRHRCWI